MDKENQKKNMLQKIPWWLFILFAILSYCLLNYILPSFGTANTTSAKLFSVMRQAAPILAVAFLLLAANALYRDDQKDPPEDSQSDQEKQDDFPENDNQSLQ